MSDRPSRLAWSKGRLLFGLFIIHHMNQVDFSNCFAMTTTTHVVFALCYNNSNNNYYYFILLFVSRTLSDFWFVQRIVVFGSSNCCATFLFYFIYVRFYLCVCLLFRAGSQSTNVYKYRILWSGLGKTAGRRHHQFHSTYVHLFLLYTVSPKNVERYDQYNITNSQHLLIIFGRKRSYSILNWCDNKFLNWLKTSCTVSITTVAT